MINEMILNMKEKNILRHNSDVLESILSKMNADNLNKNSINEALHYMFNEEKKINDFFNYELKSGRTHYQLFLDLLLKSVEINYYSYSNINNNQYAYMIMSYRVYAIYRGVLRLILASKALTHKQLRLIQKLNETDRNGLIMDDALFNPILAIYTHFIDLLEKLNEHINEVNSIDDFYNIIYDDNNIFQILSIISAITQTFNHSYDKDFEFRNLLYKYDFFTSADDSTLNYELSNIDVSVLTKHPDKNSLNNYVHYLVLNIINYKKDFITLNNK